MIHCLSFPFKRFDHADYIRAEVVINRCERVGVRRAVTINRSTEEMMCGIGNKELARRSGIPLQIKEYAMDVRFGVVIFAFGDGIRKRGIPIDELECVVGQFAQVIPNGFVGAMDSSIQRRIIEVDPVRFFRSRFDDGITRKGESIGVGPLRLPYGGGEAGCRKIDVGSVGYGDAVIAVGFGR